MALDRKDHSYWRNNFNTGFMVKLEEIKYPQTAQEIAIEIVANFPPSIFSSDLRRLIVKAIDNDRQRVKEWQSQQRPKQPID
jgi:translation elongation factor EF-Ts